MLKLIRVDDRLIHGQVVAAWVPFVKADVVIVASDEAAADSFQCTVLRSCAHKGLAVIVTTIRGAVEAVNSGTFRDSNLMVVTACLRDAMRLYDSGLRFSTLNIGNIHHDGDAREVTESVRITVEEEHILERFEGLGVRVDIRDVPSRPSKSFH
ncbi:MAG TPA: PTS mannose/fructose/sorbose transporter subunit IIB [Deltaproteobacteria bacterium]|nr:PTS mannose/fructose/sorbose transporter subunit IIB [Deltaproteobacteria bacterium]